jgi:hypothetical protein
VRIALALALGACVVGAAGFGSSSRELLPDLRQELPYRIAVERVSLAGGETYRLVFASAVSNVGEGPLIVDGSRASVSTPTMPARQVVVRDDGSTQTYAGAGRLRYVVSSDHAHWHLLQFERYELRRRDGGAPLRRDAKTGFCLGDRLSIPDALPDAPASGAFQTNCGRRAPKLLHIREGISVGYADDYKPSLEGQYLRLDGLPAGRYVLVHRVNEDRRLRELRFDNDVASALLELTFTAGVPRVRVLARCTATASCSS